MDIPRPEAPNLFLSIIMAGFIGLMVAFCVGFGVEAFYPSPQSPTMGSSMQAPTSSNPADQQAYYQSVSLQNQAKTKEYNDRMSQHNRNASVVVIAIAAVVVVLSLVLVRLPILIGDGLVLGGLFTLLYGIVLSWTTGNPKQQFLSVLAGLILGIATAYYRMIKPRHES